MASSPYIVTKGVVLRETETRDADKILTLLTAERGKLSVIARGVCRKGCKFAACAQPLAYSEWTLYKKGDWYYANEGTTLELFSGLRADLDAMALGFYLAELTERSCPAGMEQDAVLELLYYAFLVMDRGILPPKLISRIFELKLLQLNGLFASDVCHICGEGEGTLYFDGRMGAFYCEKHRTEDSIFVLDAGRRAVRFVLERESRAAFGFQLSAEALEQLTFILRKYMEVHMGIRLKTRDFFEQ